MGDENNDCLTGFAESLKHFTEATERVETSQRCQLRGNCSNSDTEQ